MGPAAHIAGVPVEEALPFVVPVFSACGLAIRAHLSGRRHPAPHLSGHPTEEGNDADDPM